MPIPINPLRYVLVYALETDKGPVLVDAGWDTAEAWDALTSGLVTAGTAVDDVAGVLVTHIHPDHYGLAGRIREASGAWIGMHPADAAMIGDRYESPEGLVERMRRAMAAAGIPERDVPTLAEASLWIRQTMRAVRPDRLVEDGDRLGGVALLLERDVVDLRSQVVAQMQAPGGAHAREDPFPCGGCAVHGPHCRAPSGRTQERITGTGPRSAR